MSDYQEIFLNTPPCNVEAKDRKTAKLRGASLSWWIATAENPEHGQQIVLLDSATADAEEKRTTLMRYARHHDVGRNQYVLLVKAEEKEKVSGRVCFGLEDALEELLVGECRAWLNEFGDLFVTNAHGHYELLWLSNHGRHWYECERGQPHYADAKQENEYCFKMLAYAPEMAVIVGDLDGRLTEMMIGKYGSLKDFTE